MNLRIVHGLIFHLDPEDGRFSVLVGQKNYIKDGIERILLQPFGGKTEDGDMNDYATLIREFEEEIRTSVAGGWGTLWDGHVHDGNTVGILTGPSDVESDKSVSIITYTIRSRTDALLEGDHEMRHPEWMKIHDVLRDTRSGTLLKLVVALMGAKRYFIPACIEYLCTLDISAFDAKIENTLAETLQHVKNDRTKYTVNVDACDHGLIALARQSGLYREQPGIPKSVTFERGKIVDISYEQTPSTPSSAVTLKPL